MCLAVPGRIVKIDKDAVTVDYSVEQRKGRLIERKYKVGDYVIIQGGIVIQKVPKKEAEASLRLFAGSCSSP